MNYSRYILLLLFFTLFIPTNLFAASDEKESTQSQIPVSPQTQLCISCHSMYTPGIVHDWMTSRHSKTIPGEALKKSSIEKRISAEILPQSLQGYAVGCYECHSLNPDIHKDNFKHMDTA